jgi:G protein-coupled receptor GPR1
MCCWRFRPSFSNTRLLSLIMLLVQAEFVKSIPFVICPLIQFATGAIDTSSPFCQFVGFFLALGIEASDVAVLLIAVHSAMYIRRPRSGLYPYRWWAYAAYVIIPVLFAALAFADGGYVDLGAYCYLARDGGWARLALSWIPRYVLVAFIVVTYLCIYIYVRTTIDRYDRKCSATQPSMANSRRPSAIWGHADRPRPDRSISSLSGHSTDQLPQPPRRAWGPIRWKFPFYRGTSLSRGQAPSDTQYPHISLGPDLALPLSVVRRPTRCSSTTAVDSFRSSSSYGSWKSSLVPATNGAATAPLPAIKQNPSESLFSPEDDMPEIRLSNSAEAQSPHPPCGDTSCRSHEEPGSEVARNREGIRRQLRSLFVYPLIYTLTWLFPLINQAFGQTHGVKAKPFWLSCLSLASFAAQGFVNAVVFTAREKPWRHTGGKGFWAGLRGRLVCPSSAERGGGGGGRTRDDMTIEACTARARREGEMMDESEAAALGVAQKSPRLEGVTRNWWDASDLDVDLERDDEEERRGGLS